jgi:hypothetical protein
MPAPTPIPAVGSTSVSNKLDPAMIASLINQLSSVSGLSTTATSGVTNIVLPTLTQEGIQR